MKAIIKFIFYILFLTGFIKVGLILVDLYGTCIFSRDFHTCKRIEELEK